MAARDRISDLPIEFARHIFRFFDYLELRPVLWTCLSWRQIALDCPQYWFMVELDKPTEGDAQTFIAHLRGSKGRPAVVFTLAPGPWATLSSAIFPELASSIGSISFLGIVAHISYMDQVFHILEHPRRELTGLLVRFSGDPANSLSAPLPRNLIQGQAPVLRMVCLTNVDLPKPSPAIFQSVTDVTFGYELPETETKAVPDLWPLFPNMRTLTVAKNAVMGDFVLSSYLSNRLEWLRPEQTLPAFVDSFPRSANAISRLPHVHVSATFTDVLETLLNDLPDTLQIALRPSPSVPGLIDFVCGDTAWHRSRAFYTRLSHWALGEKPDCIFLSRPDVVERIVSLTLPAFLWQSATHTMAPLTHLCELRLVLDVDDAIAFSQLGPLGTADCPALKSLILRVEEGEYYVTLNQVRAFAAHGLHGWRAPLGLQFENVTLEGYGRIVPDDERFTYCWKQAKQWGKACPRDQSHTLSHRTSSQLS